MKPSKLIKISETHYIIVDDSEIKEGNWCYDVALKVFQASHNFNGYNTNLCKKITHSTEPFKEFAPLTINDMGIGYIPLSEVEELIYGYSVEKMAHNYSAKEYPSNLYTVDVGMPARGTAFRGFIDGFKAHQELVKDKLFTVEDMKDAFLSGCHNMSNYIEGESENDDYDIYNEAENFIQPLLPKTEWECTINEKGKITLI